nr:MAG TPA: hypothetical protein [Caudoviricetes sp.]
MKHIKYKGRIFRAVDSTNRDEDLLKEYIALAESFKSLKDSTIRWVSIIEKRIDYVKRKSQFVDIDTELRNLKKQLQELDRLGR